VKRRGLAFEGLAWHGKRESQFIEPRSLVTAHLAVTPPPPNLFLRDIAAPFEALGRYAQKDLTGNSGSVIASNADDQAPAEEWETQ
jgi:hypothetical protein